MSGIQLFNPLDRIVRGAARLVMEASQALLSGADLRIDGLARRIKADLSNATLSNRLMFQGTTADAMTSLGLIPNGTGNVAHFVAFGGSDPDNAAWALIALDNSVSLARLISSKVGTGTARDWSYEADSGKRHVFKVNAVEVVGVDSAKLLLTGDLDLTGNSRKILGSWDAVAATSTYLENRVSNSNTFLGIKPSGTGSYGGISCFGGSDPANASVFGFRSNEVSQIAEIIATKLGTGTTRPMVFTIDSTNVFRVELDNYIRLVGRSGDPASPLDGGRWYNTSQKSNRYRIPIGTIKQSGLLHGQTSIQAGDTVANTVTETLFASGQTASLPANSLTAGKRLRIRAAGVLGTHTSGTVTIRFRLFYGSSAEVVLIDFGTQTLVTGISARTWWLEADVCILTAGSSGTMEARGIAFVPNANNDTGTIVSKAGATAVTINTTVGHIFGLKVTHGAANAANTATLRTFTVEVID